MRHCHCHFWWPWSHFRVSGDKNLKKALTCFNRFFSWMETFMGFLHSHGQVSVHFGFYILEYIENGRITVSWLCRHRLLLLQNLKKKKKALIWYNAIIHYLCSCYLVLKIKTWNSLQSLKCTLGAEKYSIRQQMRVLSKPVA